MEWQREIIYSLMHDLVVFCSTQFPTIVALMTSISRQRRGCVNNLVQRNQVHLKISTKLSFPPLQAGLAIRLLLIHARENVTKCRFLSCFKTKHVLIVCELLVRLRSFAKIHSQTRTVFATLTFSCYSSSSSRGIKNVCS